MNRKITFCIIMCTLGTHHAQAQISKEDSLHLKKMLEGKEEIIINPEAVKNIEFNFMPKEELARRKPMMVDEKPWMKPMMDLPDEFIPQGIHKQEMTFKLDLTPPVTSAPIATFDADKILFETFTARGRAIKHNRKHANAWKIYNDYVPTREDSLYLAKYKKKRTPKDTLAILTDSTHYFMNTK